MSPIQPYKTLYKSSNLSNLENVPRFGKTGPGLPIAGGGDGGCCGGGVVDDAVDDVVEDVVEDVESVLCHIIIYSLQIGCLLA